MCGPALQLGIWCEYERLRIYSMNFEYVSIIWAELLIREQLSGLGHICM